jgi:hypothetical protein
LTTKINIDGPGKARTFTLGTKRKKLFSAIEDRGLIIAGKTDVHPDSHNDILQSGKDGNKRHWMLELYFVDRKNKIGALFEQLLTAV